MVSHKVHDPCIDIDPETEGGGGGVVVLVVFEPGSQTGPVCGQYLVISVGQHYLVRP